MNVLDVLPVAVYTTDAAGRITYYNQAAADLWGTSTSVGFGPLVRLLEVVVAEWGAPKA